MKGNKSTVARAFCLRFHRNNLEDVKRMGSLRNARKGYILISALVIALLGAAIAAGMFVVADNFSSERLRQRPAYEQHVDIVGEIQKVQAFIVEKNKENAKRGKAVLHGQGYSGSDYGKGKNPSMMLTSLENLQVTGYPTLVRDDRASGTNPALVVQVYDSNYTWQDVAPALLSQMSSLEFFPPSVFPKSHRTKGGNDEQFTQVGEDQSTPDDPNAVYNSPSAGGGSATPSTGATGQPPEVNQYSTYGAYVVRARLFTRLSPDSPWKLQREARQGFAVLVSMDVAP